jgi:hypothetical protein
VPFLADLIALDPQPTVTWSFADAAYTGAPFGLVLGLPTRAFVYLQAVGAHPGDDHSRPERPVYGTPLPPMRCPTLPASGMTNLVDVQRYLGSLLCGAACAELAAVELYADRDRSHAVPHGLTTRWHNGGAVFLYFRHYVSTGRSLPEEERPFRPAVWL